ncbi:MAG: DnaJ domain-containing protein [Cyanobacteria bacterium P01_D01_bin.123]
MEPANYYQRLGVARDATDDEIRAAYRRLVRELHPDALPPETPERVRAMAEAEFARLQEAYEVLSDPVSRTTYDDVQANWALVTRIDRRPVERAARPWLVPAASAFFGAAIAVTSVALANGLTGKQPASRTIEFRANEAEVTQSTSSSESDVAGPASQPNVISESEETEALAEGFASEAESFSRGELTRFAATAIEIKPVVRSVEQRLQIAQTAAEREQIEREFDVEATKIIEANGLSTETYQAIARVAESNETIRQAVTSAAARLQGS